MLTLKINSFFFENFSSPVLGVRVSIEILELEQFPKICRKKEIRKKIWDPEQKCEVETFCVQDC